MTPLEKRKADFAAKKENEIWLYSYADLITNLLAFFLMILVATKSDPSNKEKIQRSISAITKSGGNRVVSTDEELATYIAQSLKDLGLQNNVALDRQKNGVNLVFSGGLFFDTNSAALTPDALELLTSLSPVFDKLPMTYHLDIEGHADSRPIVNSTIYPSNWELSAARAGAVVRYLASKGIAATRLRAVGYADTRPSGQGSQGNRRVVIAISGRTL